MSESSEFVDTSFFTSEDGSIHSIEKDSEQQAAESRNNMYSFRQIGSAVTYVEPINGGVSMDSVREMFSNQPDLEAVPVEQDDTVIGILSRKEVETATATVLKRFISSNCIEHTKECPVVLYAREYFENVVAKVNRINREQGIVYFPVFHSNKSFYGIISIDEFEERLSQVREQDLEKAQAVQQNMLPKEDELATLPFKVSIWNRMANKVGGDFYCAHRIADGFYVVGSFDVSGKNVAAALLTVLLSAFFSMLKYVYSRTSPSVDEITSMLDRYLEEVMPVGSFITGVLCYITTNDNKVKIQNCGHTLVYVMLPVEKSGTKGIGLAHIDAALPPLGMGAVAAELGKNKDSKDSVVFPLRSGLHLNIYTDGFTDMQAEDGTRFGDDRVKNFFMKQYNIAPSEIRSNVEHTVDEWVQKTPLSDDITVMDIRFM